MRKKKVEAISVRSFKKQLAVLIKEHGKAIVISAGDGDLRRRLIKDDGSCNVSYRYYGKHRWSRYEDSCFMSYTEDQTTSDFRYVNGRGWVDTNPRVKKGKKKTVKNTLDALLKHDKDNELIPLEIQYGKGLKKSLYIIGNY